MTWAKNEPVDEERALKQWIRDTQKWGAETCRAIAQAHRMPPSNPAAARDWGRAAAIVSPDKARRR